MDTEMGDTRGEDSFCPVTQADLERAVTNVRAESIMGRLELAAPLRQGNSATADRWHGVTV